MTDQPQTTRNAPSILIWAVVFLLAYGVFLHFSRYDASLAESNLQANLIRSSHYLNDPPAPIVLVGSSVAGRLLPEYFLHEGLAVQNLGLDGSRPLFAFEVLEKRQKLPKCLLIDTSTLFQPLMANDGVLRDALSSTSWQIASVVSLMRPENRPSSLLYSAFKKKKELLKPGTEQSPWIAHDKAPPSPSKITQAWRPEDQYETVRQQLVKFQSQGVKVVLLNIPRGQGWGEPASGLERKLSDELRIQLLEPGLILAKKGERLTFSDGLHLDTTSAAKVTTEIVQELRQSQ